MKVFLEDSTDNFFFWKPLTMNTFALKELLEVSLKCFTTSLNLLRIGFQKRGFLTLPIITFAIDLLSIIGNRCIPICRQRGLGILRIDRPVLQNVLSAIGDD